MLSKDVYHFKKKDLPSTITKIGEHAFIGCYSLTTIDLPSTITYIDSDAFQGCSSLHSIRIPSSTTVHPSDFEETTIIHYYDINENQTNRGRVEGIGTFLNNLEEPGIRNFFQEHLDIHYWTNPQDEYVNKSIPLQQLVEAKCSFTVIHTFVNSGLMKAIQKEPKHKKTIENFKKIS